MESSNEEVFGFICKRMQIKSEQGKLLLKMSIESIIADFSQTNLRHYNLYYGIVRRMGTIHPEALAPLETIVRSVIDAEQYGFDTEAVINSFFFMGWLSINSESNAEKIKGFLQAILNNQEDLEIRILPAIQTMQHIRVWGDSRRGTIPTLCSVLRFIQDQKNIGEDVIGNTIPAHQFIVNEVGVENSFAFAFYVVHIFKLDKVSQFLTHSFL